MNTLFLDRGEGKIAYEVAGSGPLVVCSPSMGDVRGEFRFLVPQLVQAGYTAATMDLRGHGESSVEWADYSAAGIGADIVALIKHLDAGPALIVGDSISAGAVVCAAAEAPDLVAGLVVIGPFLRDTPSLMNVVMRGVSRLLFSGPWAPGAWLRFYASLYPTRKPADFEAYQAALGASLREPGRMRALRKMILAANPGFRTRLPRVKAPALVILGTRDPDFKDPSAEARWVAEQIHGEVRMIKDAGHYPHAEMPAETGEAILTFLQKVTAGTAEAKRTMERHGA